VSEVLLHGILIEPLRAVSELGFGRSPICLV